MLAIILYEGPAPQWLDRGFEALSIHQIAEMENRVWTNSEDHCARGYLIAHGQGKVPRHTEHMLWMIAHHPEWDGFLVNHSAAHWDGSDAYNLLREAWLKHIGPEQTSGEVLHNAAIFFSAREPDLAEDLLQRATRLAPDDLFHVEGLGVLYGQALRGKAPAQPFATHALAVLLATKNWLVIAAAMLETRWLVHPETARLVFARYREIVGDESWSDLKRQIPSRSLDHSRYRCPREPLLNGCWDRQ